MNTRLVWNYEFSPPKFISFKDLGEYSKSPIKWEFRLFWPEDQKISLNLIDQGLLDLSCYEQKHKEDCYFIIPNSDYNIKRRRNELLYKPLLEKTPHALGFGSKIALQQLDLSPPESHKELKNILQQVHKKGRETLVKKEAFVYKFATTPAIKLELARLEVHQRIYFSICVEGRSRILVETLSHHLLGKQVSCDYVSFLKSVQNS